MEYTLVTGPEMTAAEVSARNLDSQRREWAALSRTLLLPLIARVYSIVERAAKASQNDRHR